MCVNGETGNETFNSEVIDLDGADLSAVGKLPSAVLRSAIERVCRELSGDGGAFASFQSSIRVTQTGGEQVSPVNPGVATSGDGNHERREQPGSSALPADFGATAVSPMTPMCRWAGDVTLTVDWHLYRTDHGIR